MTSIKSEYVEQRNGGYYIAGSRISLDSILYALRRGEKPETILEHFPTIGLLAKVYGAIAFALDHPKRWMLTSQSKNASGRRGTRQTHKRPLRRCAALARKGLSGQLEGTASEASAHETTRLTSPRSAAEFWSRMT